MRLSRRGHATQHSRAQGRLILSDESSFRSYSTKFSRWSEEISRSFCIPDDGSATEWRLKKDSHPFCLESFGKAQPDRLQANDGEPFPNPVMDRLADVSFLGENFHQLR